MQASEPAPAPEPNTSYPCPGVWISPDRLSGAPAIVGHRIFADTPYQIVGQHWQPGQDPRAWYPVFTASGWDVTYDEFLAAWCWEAGRRYGEQHNRGDQRRRRLRTVEDADEWRAKGYAEGLAAAASYLRDSGRGDWAVVLTTTLGEQRKERRCDD